MDGSHLNRLIESIQQELLPKLQLESIAPNDPVEVRHLPEPWQIIGAGNYAAVFSHPDYPNEVVKIYAPGREGFEEELEVYRRLGSHPAFSECLYAGENFLVLKRLYGVTLYDCIHRGVRIPVQVIRDIDRALDYARQRGLRPHDVHGRNVMMYEGRGLVVDISDFLHEDACHKWENLKRAYYWLYRPVVSPLRLRIPYEALDVVRKGYRFVSQRKRVAIAIGMGVAIVLVTTPIYIHWRRANECVRYLPDGSQKTLYGKDCQR
ncbi:MAG TPA: serine/threonine protein kinase [Allocoleopsis sp.]